MIAVAPADQRQDTRSARLADLIIGELAGAAEGHCVRVNFLDRGETEAVCAAIRSRGDGTASGLDSYVLTGMDSPVDDPLMLTADRAIELRNRKRGRLCLFVPSDLVDATISSLGNSFAELDGRDLHRRAAERVLEDVAQPTTREVVRRIRSEIGRAAGVSHDEELDFILIASEREKTRQLETLGLELWRVGLIADARPDFDLHLPANRRNARLLARPQRLDAPFRDRIASLKVSAKTARDLELFFARRSMHDIRRWSRELAEGEGPTFDQWVFPETVQTNLESVRVLPFTDARGEVQKTSKLIQPDGPGGSLLAPCGEKQFVSVKWETEPLKPNNVHAWELALVPASADGELDDDTAYLELPSREVKGTGRTGRLKLDLEFDEAPESTFTVRVVAIDETGNEVVDEDGQPIAATSDEFYLTRDPGDDTPGGAGQRRRTVASLAEGRLRAAMESKDTEIALTQPAWAEGRGVHYFTARANERTLLNLAVSPLLLELERLTLAEARTGGRWELHLDEVRPASLDTIQTAPFIGSDDGAWADFWRARSTFFDRLRQAEIRNVIEAAEWTTELTNAALRYAQTYRTLLDVLDPDYLPDVLSVDTLAVRLDLGETVEEAVVVLPTHPLRAAWFASHAALLRTWEERVLQSDRRARRRLADLDLVQDLRPTNMPAFVQARAGDAPFVFFQNLGFFHGVALPADVPDPLRRYGDIAAILGFENEPGDTDDRRPDRLARHLRDFQSVHPYADPFHLALVNPDQGEFIAGALEHLHHQRRSAMTDDDEEAPAVPAFDITAYVLDEQQTALPGLNRFRTRQQERRTRYGTDHLQPGLATSIRPLSHDASNNGVFRAAHVAVVSDLSQPAVRALPDAEVEGLSGSISLYGLITRFVGAFQVHDGGAVWQYRVVTASPAKLEPHPAGQRFNDTLIDLQSSLLHAMGRTLDASRGNAVAPGLEVRLDRERVGLLERLHAETDWVVTLDRFFGVDYYDSPNDAALGEVARKYLIDYSPEFSEGLGHRMIVTTAWRDEVAVILRRAMDELGFAAVEGSVRQLLHYLKTVSGRLALRALNPDTGAAAAVSLGAVMAWLQAKRRLGQAILVPVDAHLDLFGSTARGPIQQGQRRCDLALFSLRRGIVEATFIEVKWRRGPLGSIDDLVQDMDLQMQMTANTVNERFFDQDRVDGALQRAYLANVLRFYCARAQRYGLLDPGAAPPFLAHLAQLEKAGLDYRPSYEGFIISLEDPGRRPVIQDNLRVSVLTASDFHAASTELITLDAPSPAPAMPSSGAPPRVPSIVNGQTPVVDAVMPGGAAAPKPPQAQATENDQASTAPESSNEYQEHPLQEPVPDAPPAPESEPEIVLGDTASGEIVWLPSVKGSPHLFVTGIPGQGKSWTVLRLLTELSRQGVPALVYDFHGQFGAPDSPFVQTAQPTVVDAASGLPFSPFECSADASAAGWNATALTISEIFAYVCGLGDIQRDTLFTCIRDAYRTYGFGSPDSETPDAFPSLQDVMRRIEHAEQQKRTQNLVPRCRPLLEMDIFRPPAGARTNLIETIRGGLVVDLHNLASETLQIAAGAFLLRKIYRDMFSWGVADRLRLAIVLDEAHRLARDVTLPKIMKEGRKFGVAVIVASQGLADFHPDVLGNAGTKIAFRANYPESRKIAGFFRARAGYDLVALLEMLQVGNALVQTPEMPMASRVAMRSPH